MTTTKQQIPVQMPVRMEQHLHQTFIQDRQMARRLALQTLFEIDSVGHLAGNVVDARLANPEPNEEGEDPAVVVS